MDEFRFDSLTQTLSTAGSRRALAAALVLPLGLLGLSHPDGAAARKKKKTTKAVSPPCQPQSHATTCASQCGTWTAPRPCAARCGARANNCGQAVTCGTCPTGFTCLGDGTCARSCTFGSDCLDSTHGCYDGACQTGGRPIPRYTCDGGVGDCPTGYTCLATGSCARNCSSRDDCPDPASACLDGTCQYAV